MRCAKNRSKKKLWMVWVGRLFIRTPHTRTQHVVSFQLMPFKNDLTHRMSERKRISVEMLKCTKASAAISLWFGNGIFFYFSLYGVFKRCSRFSTIIKKKCLCRHFIKQKFSGNKLTKKKKKFLFCC